MPTSDLTSLVPPQFSRWLQVRKVGTAFLFSFVRSLLEEAIIGTVLLPRLSILQCLQPNINNSTLKTEDLYYFGFQLIKHTTVT